MTKIVKECSMVIIWVFCTPTIKKEGNVLVIIIAVLGVAAAGGAAVYFVKKKK